MKLEFYILGSLTISPKTGYEIKKLLDTEGRFGRASAPLSQIYTTLKRMKANDWVYFKEISRDSKPNLKVYYLTETGTQVFLDYLSTPGEPPFRFRESDLTYRMMFSFLLEPDVIIKQIEGELAYRKKQIATFRNRDRTLKSKKLTPAQRAYAQDIYDLLHTFGTRAIDEYVESLAEALEFFKQRKHAM